MAQAMYPKGKLEVWTSGLLPTGTENYELILLDEALGYAFSDGDEFVADISAFELVTTGYSRPTLTGVSVALAGATVGFHADMVTFTGLGVGPSWPEAQAGIVARKVTDDSDSWLLCYLDTITAITNGDDLIVTWDTDGIIYG